jgi:hypothetical protein
MTLALFCGSAFAAVEVQNTGSAVTVTKSADETQFTIHKDGVTNGQFYLVMIQQGDASALPTSENLYYMNVYTASGTAFDQTVYPKDLTAGTYAVFLSDYSTETSNGARSQVATLTVGESTGSGGGNTGTSTGSGDNTGGSGTSNPRYGDVNGDEDIDEIDEMILSRYLAGWSGYGPNQQYNVISANADVNLDGEADEIDEMILSRHIAGWSGYDLPFRSN